MLKNVLKKSMIYLMALIFVISVASPAFATPVYVAPEELTDQQFVDVQPFTHQRVNVPAALIFANATGGSALGQINSGAVVQIVNQNPGGARVQIVVIATGASANGWTGHTVWTARTNLGPT